MGDPQQLPATVKSIVAQRLQLQRSLFERLQVTPLLLLPGALIVETILSALSNSS